ncbi:MAG: hypothetical protein AAF152_10535 [Cyanobacteria bacterium P01_A01_bin.114]
MTHSPLQSRSETFVSRLLITLTAAYVFCLLLSPPGWLPGEPIWAIRPETIQEILDESINFFFVLPILNQLGIHLMEAPVVHPAMEAFFNLAEAWIFMFLPLLLLDPRGGGLPRVSIWGAAMFLTNVFLMPYMALRLGQQSEPQNKPPGKKPIWVNVFGWIGLGVGAIALYWFGWAFPEFGSFWDRAIYLGQQVAGSRVTLAFCVDLVLFGVFQSILMGAAIPTGSPLRWLRFIPFWGLALWLIFPAQPE